MQKPNVSLFISLFYAAPLILILSIFGIYFYYSCSVSTCGSEWIFLILIVVMILGMSFIIKKKPEEVLNRLSRFRRKERYDQYR